MKRTTIIILLGSLMTLTGSMGCSDDGEGTMVIGSLHADLGYAEAGFEFSHQVRLVDSPEEVDSSCAAGGCVLRIDDQGNIAEAELWLDRGIEDEQEQGLRTFDVIISQEMVSLGLGVRASNGIVSYTASGGAQCFISDLSDVSADGAAHFAADCALLSDDGQDAQLTAELSFSGCRVESLNP